MINLRNAWKNFPEKGTLTARLINPHLYIANTVPGGTRLVTTHPHLLSPKTILPQTSRSSTWYITTPIRCGGKWVTKRSLTHVREFDFFFLCPTHHRLPTGGYDWKCSRPYQSLLAFKKKKNLSLTYHTLPTGAYDQSRRGLTRLWLPSLYLNYNKPSIMQLTH